MRPTDDCCLPVCEMLSGFTFKKSAVSLVIYLSIFKLLGLLDFLYILSRSLDFISFLRCIYKPLPASLLIASTSAPNCVVFVRTKPESTVLRRNIESWGAIFKLFAMVSLL